MGQTDGFAASPLEVRQAARAKPFAHRQDKKKGSHNIKTPEATFLDGGKLLSVVQ